MNRYIASLVLICFCWGQGVYANPEFISHHQTTQTLAPVGKLQAPSREAHEPGPTESLTQVDNDQRNRWKWTKRGLLVCLLSLPGILGGPLWEVGWWISDNFGVNQERPSAYLEPDILRKPIIVTNGVQSDNPKPGELPIYMKDFTGGFEDRDFGVIPISFFNHRFLFAPGEGDSRVGGGWGGFKWQARKIWDTIHFFWNADTLSKELIRKVKKTEIPEISEEGEGVIVVGYSAGADLWLRALEMDTSLNVRMVVSLDGVTLQNKVKIENNPHVEKVLLFTSGGLMQRLNLSITPDRIVVRGGVTVVSKEIPSHYFFGNHELENDILKEIFEEVPVDKDISQNNGAASEALVYESL